MGRIIRESVLVGDKELTIETGRMAKQANGAVLVQCGESVALVTACGGPEKDLPFFPLTCDYVEKMYASGRIPGGFFKREGRLGEKETLTSRLIDRPIRPLFPDGYRREVQIIATILSHDTENATDVLAITGASTALMLSDLPFQGPIAGVRIGRIDGNFVANPTFSERAESDCNIILVATEDAIVMVEGEADEISEADFVKAMEFGREAVADSLALQRRLAEAVGKEKMEFESPKADEEIVGRVRDDFSDKLVAALTVEDKLERRDALDALKDEVVETLGEAFEEREDEIKDAFKKVKSDVMRRMVTRDKKRIDGRALDEVRDITCEVGVLPRTHGSALFTRGETQALVTLTLGTDRDEQRMEELTGTHFKKFLLHYNFPPFSVGECRFLRGPKRREIGHGILAHRALSPVLPTYDEENEFPYTIRMVSEVLESNGSSSMATVCGGSLAAMDAGIEIGKPVAGIAMGLVKEGDDIAILSDILGDEDHMGDMDFKVCGTPDGITAIQMDVKIAGISNQTLSDALEQARKGREFILEKMNETIQEPRSDMSSHAPRIVTIKINPSKIRDVIGAGGKTIRGIVAQTGANINVEDDGSVDIACDNEEGLNEAIEMIRTLTREAQAGEVYLGNITNILPFGAIVELFPGTDGLLHITEISEGHVDEVEDVLSQGEEVLVKVLSVDRQGKIRLSRKAALGEKPTKFA